ncbi:MAG: sulfite exporter TauE/SafE family protein [Pseudomonadota bacterium]
MLVPAAEMVLLASILALLVGITLGLLGGGGSILTLPLLVYLVGMEEKQGIAGSLFVVAVTSLVALVSHARAGRVHWSTGILFGLVGMIGAFTGGRAAAWIPGQYLLLGFGAVALATAMAMIRGRKEAPPRDGPLPVAKVVALGLLVGSISGLVGAGGGFLIVPALTLLGGLPMADAIGTSLLVIALQSLAGLAGHATHVQMDWPLLGTIAAFAVAGSLFGSRIGRKLSAAALRQSFGWFVLCMAGFILLRETPAELLGVPALRAGGAVALLLVVGAAIRNIRVSRTSEKEKIRTNHPPHASNIRVSSEDPRGESQ